jgi:hypothetical protein
MSRDYFAKRIAGEQCIPYSEALRAVRAAEQPDAVHHRYVLAEGVYCGACPSSRGMFGRRSRWWTCGECGQLAPVDDLDLIPGTR